jgi:hypothetical protein
MAEARREDDSAGLRRPAAGSTGAGPPFVITPFRAVITTDAFLREMRPMRRIGGLIVHRGMRSLCKTTTTGQFREHP